MCVNHCMYGNLNGRRSPFTHRLSMKLPPYPNIYYFPLPNFVRYFRPPSSIPRRYNIFSMCSITFARPGIQHTLQASSPQWCKKSLFPSPKCHRSSISQGISHRTSPPLDPGNPYKAPPLPDKDQVIGGSSIPPSSLSTPTLMHASLFPSQPALRNQ